MNKKRVDQYYYFGTSIRYLQDVKVGWPIHEEDFLLDNINRFFNHLNNINLVVTKRASHKLIKFKEKIESKDKKTLITQEEASELSTIMNNIRHTLDAEIAGIEAFITVSKRYDNDILFSDIGKLFSPNVFENFEDIAKHDFNEAGKCIVFERPTAAAFHILRATEANLRYFYKNMIKQKRIKSELWGPIIQDLKLKTKTKTYTTLNNHLDNIRSSFRNPTQHPEAIYDIHETQDLLAICIDANNRMFKILESN